MAVAYINGTFYDSREEAKVSIWDHGYLYGDGIFEGIRVYEGNIFRCREHMIRLYDSAKTIALEMPMKIEELENLLVETVRRTKMLNCYIRLIVTRGVGDLGIDPRKCSKPTIAIIADTIQLFPPQTYIDGVKAIIASTRKNHVASCNPNIKSLNYLNCIMAKIEANHAGVNEAILLNHEGYVTEGTADNIFVVKNGIIKTPPPSAGILVGITRNAILETAWAQGIAAFEVNITNFDLYSADEIFLSGTGAELLPVIELDKRVIGNGKPGPVYLTLLEGLRARTTKEGIPVYTNAEMEEMKAVTT